MALPGALPAAGVIGLLAPNLLVVAAMVGEVRRGEAVHLVYRLGLPVSILTEAATLILTPTSVGQFLAATLAHVGRLLAPLY